MASWPCNGRAAGDTRAVPGSCRRRGRCAFPCHWTAAAKLPVSEYAAARVVRPWATFQSVSSHARVAETTACSPLRILGSGQVARIQARPCWASASVGSSRIAAFRSERARSKSCFLEPDASANTQTTRRRRIETNGFVQVFECLVILAVRQEVDSTRLVGVGTAGIDLDRMVKDLEGLLEVRSKQIDRRQPDVGVEALGIDPNGDIELGDRRLSFAPLEVDHSLAQVNDGGSRAEPDGVLEIAQGFAMLLHAKVEDAPFDVGIRVSGVELDRLVDVGKSQVEPIPALPEVRSLDQGRDVFGVQANALHRRRQRHDRGRHSRIGPFPASRTRTGRADWPGSVARRTSRHG